MSIGWAIFIVTLVQSVSRLTSKIKMVLCYPGKPYASVPIAQLIICCRDGKSIEGEPRSFKGFILDFYCSKDINEGTEQTVDDSEEVVSIQ